jgi:cardiolipin synthase
LLNLPNTLTLFRILLVPLFLSLLVQGNVRTALVVFIAAGLTDAIDGALARLMNSQTNLGAHLDPMADKLLLVSSFIALGFLGKVPLPLMIMVIMRDVVILGGFLLSAVLTGKSMAMHPSLWGKLTTFVQILTVALVLLAASEWVAVPVAVLSSAFVATGALSVVSGVGYVADGIRWYQSAPWDNRTGLSTPPR